MSGSNSDLGIIVWAFVALMGILIFPIVLIVYGFLLLTNSDILKPGSSPEMMMFKDWGDEKQIDKGLFICPMCEKTTPDSGMCPTCSVKRKTLSEWTDETWS